MTDPRMIRRRRKALGISLKELADELGISLDTVGNYESRAEHRDPRSLKERGIARYMAALDRLKERWNLEEKWEQ